MQRSWGKWECTVVISIESSERIDGPAATNHHDRRSFNVVEQLCYQTAPVVALLLFSKWQIECSTEDQPVPLVVQRYRTFGTNRVGIFRLLIKIGSVIQRLR